MVVEGKMFIYKDPSDIRRSVASDVFVVLDHDLGRRSTYKLWAEGKPPDFALEVISSSSRIRNRSEKKDLYALWGRKDVDLPGVLGPGGGLELRSERMGVSVRVDGERLPGQDS